MSSAKIRKKTRNREIKIFFVIPDRLVPHSKRDGRIGNPESMARIYKITGSSSLDSPSACLIGSAGGNDTKETYK